MLAALVVVSIVGAVLTYQIADTNKGLAAVLVAAVLLTGVERLMEALVQIPALFTVQQTLEMRDESIVLPEEFEKAFGELARICGVLVLLVDNLDRCEADTVVDVLRTIKTFLEPADLPVFFVIACDDDAVRRHILSRAPAATPDEYAEEYLRKLFNVGITVIAAGGAEIEKYTEGLLDDTALRTWSAEERTEAAQLVPSAVGHVPRRVKQFLNRVAAKKLLLEERQVAQVFLPDFKPRASALILACAIEEQCPQLGRVIALEPAIITDLRASFENRFGLEIQAAAPFRDNDRVRELFRIFTDVDEAQLGPLFTLHQDRDRHLVEQPEELRRRLQIGDGRWLVERLNSVASIPDFVRFVLTNVKVFHTNQMQYFLQAAEAAGYIVAALEARSEATQATRLASSVLDSALDQAHRERFLATPIEQLSALARNAPAPKRATLANHLVSLIHSPSGTYTSLDKYKDNAYRQKAGFEVANWDDVQPNDRQRLGDALANACDNEPPLLDRLLESENRQLSITQTVVAQRLKTITHARLAEAAGEELPELAFIARLLGRPELERPLEGAVVALLTAMQPSLGPQAADPLWRWMRSIGLPSRPWDHVKLAELIGALVPQQTQEARSFALAELIALLPRLSDAPRARAEEIVTRHLPTEESRYSLAALKVRFGEDLATLDESFFVAKLLTQRWRSFAGELDLARNAITLAARTDKVVARSFLAATFEAGEFTVLSPEDLSDLYAKADRSELDTALSGLRAGISRSLNDESRLRLAFAAGETLSGVDSTGAPAQAVSGALTPALLAGNPASLPKSVTAICTTRTRFNGAVIEAHVAALLATDALRIATSGLADTVAGLRLTKEQWHRWIDALLGGIAPTLAENIRLHSANRLVQLGDTRGFPSDREEIVRKRARELIPGTTGALSQALETLGK
jgi:hypothetical protein